MRFGVNLVSSELSQLRALADRCEGGPARRLSRRKRAVHMTPLSSPPPSPSAVQRPLKHIYAVAPEFGDRPVILVSRRGQGGLGRDPGNAQLRPLLWR